MADQWRMRIGELLGVTPSSSAAGSQRSPRLRTWSPWAATHRDLAAEIPDYHDTATGVLVAPLPSDKRISIHQRGIS